MYALRKWAAEQKHGSQSVEVSDNIIAQFSSRSKVASFQLKISNNTHREIRLQTIEMSNADTIKLITAEEEINYRDIRPNTEFIIDFNVDFCPGQINDTAFVTIHFGSDTVQRRIQIIYDPSTYFRKEAYAIRRNYYDVPKNLLENMKQNISVQERIEMLNKIIPLTAQLNYNNYGAYFHGLLHLEEIGLLRKFQIYNQPQGVFRSNEPVNRSFTLDVPKVFETRPSLNVGDYVGAIKISGGTRIAYEGTITELLEDRVVIRFKNEFIKTFKSDSCETYSVKFFFNRASFVHGHRAIDLALQMFDSDYLFPHKIIERDQLQMNTTLDDEFVLRFAETDEEIPWFNSDLNELQKRAVNEILMAKCAMPYIVFGPPGTGKTTTLTEAVLQLNKLIENSRILITAQSNSAANLIAQRLIVSGNLDQTQLLRLSSLSYARTDRMPDDLVDYGATVYLKQQNDDDVDQELRVKTLYSVDALKNFRLVVGTTVSISSLAESSQLDFSFTHVFIDEAGQCTEVDALMPMLLVGQNGQTVMAGDPMQMAPLIFDKFAQKLGLTESLLKRLLDYYEKLSDDQIGTYDSRLVTKLLRSYRSLPSILEFYNNTFYNSELIPMVSPKNSREAKILKFLMDKEVIPMNILRHAIYFTDVNGYDTKLDTASWCNLEESLEVQRLVQKLLDAGISSADIGIISPYQLQTKLLRNCINENMGLDILIGTVEEFQGQERLIIIMSTVRTSVEDAHLDVKRRLGFVKCEKRLNVAVSRARALFIVVGKAKMLESDSNWNALIDDCKLKGTFISPPEESAVD